MVTYFLLIGAFATTGLLYYLLANYNKGIIVYLKVSSFRIPLIKFTYLIGLLFAFSPVLVILTCRYGVGTDYFNYKNQVELFLAGSYKLDWGLGILVSFSNKVFGNFEGFIFLTSMITLVLFCSALLYRYKGKKCILSLFFMFCIYYGIWSNNIQQAMAMGIVVFALFCIEKNRLVMFVILVLFAGAIHNSAWAILPIYFVINHNPNKDNIVFWKFVLRVIFVIFAAIIIYTFFTMYGQSRGLMYSTYITKVSEGGRTNKFLLISILFYIPELIFMKRVLKKKNNMQIYYVLIFVELCLYIMTLYVAFMYRMAQYFSISHIFIINEILDIVTKKRDKQLMKLYFIGAMLIYTWFIYIYLGYYGLVPYKFIFSN